MGLFTFGEGDTVENAVLKERQGRHHDVGQIDIELMLAARSPDAQSDSDRDTTLFKIRR